MYAKWYGMDDVIYVDFVVVVCVGFEVGGIFLGLYIWTSSKILSQGKECLYSCHWEIREVLSICHIHAYT